nr:MerR family transcriptional regulator [uncultured Clostridium sp.]
MTIKEVSEKFNISQDTLRYYERIGMIPKVGRTPGGMRDYKENDLGWIELSICMRNAGLPIEVIIEYVKLTQEGDITIEARFHLLQEQLEVLFDQQRKINETIKRLQYKISRYKVAVQTGILTWDSQEGNQEE